MAGENQRQENEQPQQSKGYSKKPLWQWILIYLIIGGIIYFAVYYLFLSGNGLGY